MSFNLYNFNKKELTNINIELPRHEWIHKWGIDEYGARMLYGLVIDKKPEVIIETGTFEGQGTYVLAQAAHINNNNCRIYTIDYDGDPTSDSISKEEWLSLKKVRDTNLNKIKTEFSNCEIIFLDGDSRQMIPKIFDPIGKYRETKCDLFYQDSMHFIEGIKDEWELVEPNIIKNSVIIFDDLQLKGVKTFRDWFVKNYNDKYDILEKLEGHEQLIVCKI